MGTLLMILSTITAILLIVIVLLQNSKGGGLDSSFGNVNQLGGVAQSTETIEKATWTLAAVMGFLSLLAAFNFGGGNNEISTDIDKNEGISLPSSGDPVNLPIDLPN
ncbi:MAG: preprotein translocase subunit SecG [Crocinitomicaceae bacterium]|nr:preprotein translocase subunit SecG [Crocinitomicaceae bacterium]|tara:strand:+ start:180 stop:500 length:321 start_codon:yes stop_codon:yes gene_type:complete